MFNGPYRGKQNFGSAKTSTRNVVSQELFNIIHIDISAVYTYKLQ